MSQDFKPDDIVKIPFWNLKQLVDDCNRYQDGLKEAEAELVKVRAKLAHAEQEREQLGGEVVRIHAMIRRAELLMEDTDGGVTSNPNWGIIIVSAPADLAAAGSLDAKERR